MKQCHEIVRRIHESDGELDRETAAHCLTCASCRRELAACLAAADPESEPVPDRLDRETVALCRGGRSRRLRFRVERALIWSGAAAALCLVAVNLPCFSPAPEPVPEWSGAALFGELAEIGSRLTETGTLVAAGADVADRPI